MTTSCSLNFLWRQRLTRSLLKEQQHSRVLILGAACCVCFPYDQGPSGWGCGAARALCPFILPHPDSTGSPLTPLSPQAGVAATCLQATEVPCVCSWVKRESTQSSLTNSAFHLAWPLTLQTCTLADHCLVMAT